VDVIKTADSNPKIGVRKLAEMYDYRKTQISIILKDRQSILELFEVNVHSVSSRKRTRPCDINKALHEWYLLACSKNIYLVGSQLCEKAKQIAERFQKPEFKASNAWLDRWKKRYYIKHVKINGESVEHL